MAAQDHLMDNAEAENGRNRVNLKSEHDEEREKRITWWREARVGLFIHWGLYSLPGGVWKGEKADGAYAEHLQLRARIPVNQYEEIASRFNPVRFDAEQWVQAAKEAGLKYIIVTAKHHEGFAMYDSAVSDYNIVKATPFRRDPMAELAAACRREGIVPCFYYSHAMDWHHPDSQGNTLDFPGNIGAYDSLESWVDDEDKRTRYDRYLNEKAFPQIQELLTQYGPVGIVWFDCGHKVTDEQGKRFADWVHRLQPDCLVNSRVRREGFGDYRNTGDNQLHVRGQAKDWESIATLNHSWGYNQTDQDWKTAKDILHDMINVVSMGGNYVINVGPTGDGEFDPKSLELLGEIGSWLKQNGESIYGTEGSPIGKMPWGRCTSKGNTLYLHVWDWPVHGELIVPGLLNQVKCAALLADSSNTPLPHRRLNSQGDFAIEVPPQAPDPSCTVIAVEFEGELAANPLRVLFAGDVSNVFSVFDGELFGKTLRFDTGKKGRDNVKNWSDREAYIGWKFRAARPGVYRITAVYGANDSSAGGTFVVTAGQAKLKAAVNATGGEYQFQAHELGLIEFTDAGEYTLTVQPDLICGNVLMNLKEIVLVDGGRR